MLRRLRHEAARERKAEWGNSALSPASIAPSASGRLSSTITLTQRISLQTHRFVLLQLKGGGEKAPEHLSPGGIPTEQGMGKPSRGIWGLQNPARCRMPPGQGEGPCGAAGNNNLFCGVKDPRASPALCHWERLLSQLGMFYFILLFIPLFSCLLAKSGNWMRCLFYPSISPSLRTEK